MPRSRSCLEVSIDVSNVYIYLSDALRWDYVPKEIQQKGATFKTIASACATPRALPSILTGFNPPHHGVAWWSDRLNEPTIYNIPNTATGFYNPAAGDHGGLSHILGRESEETLSKIEPPFIYLERGQGGHAPYHDFTFEEMLSEMKHTKSEIELQYSKMVEESADRFKQRLEILAERDILDDTLVIFLSDHGELLGEYGLVSHTAPVVPELVYVPTVFIHPNISGGLHSETIGHIDIAPTVSSALDKPLEVDEVEGVDLFEDTPDSRYNDAVVKTSIAGGVRTVYNSAGLWDGNGGYVFTKQGKLLSPLIGLKKAQGWNRKYWMENPTRIPEALICMSAPFKKYRNPKFNKDIARKKIIEIQNSESSSERVEVDEEVEEQLRELGYKS